MKNLTPHSKSIASILTLTFLGMTSFSVFAEDDAFKAILEKRKKQESKKPTAAAQETASAPKKEEKTEEAPAPIAHKKKKKKIEADEAEKPVAAEGPAAPDASGQDGKAELILKIENDCYVVNFESRAGEGISCTEGLPLEYSKRECETSKLKEVAASEALVSCEGDKRIGLHFKTSDHVIATDLRVHHVPAGKAGTKNHYVAENARYEQTGMAKFLKEAEQKPLAGEKPAESPLTAKFSGFAYVEHEYSRNLSYADHPIASQFDKSLLGSSAQRTSLMANLNAEVSKDRTSLVSTLQFGETYFGDSSSGGAQGGKAKAIGVRQLYLAHGFTDRLGLKGGMITLASDPRMFIFSDQIASALMTYKTDLLESTLWYGNAAQSGPGVVDGAKDKYLGFQGTLAFLSKVKGTVFGVYRARNQEHFAKDDGAGGFADTYADSNYYWGGGTFSYDGWNPVALEFTGIGNWGSAKDPSGLKDNVNSYLFDTKVTYAWAAPQIIFTLEGLMTPGAKGVTQTTTSGSSAPVMGRRHGFISPVNTAYLMTVATSDGLDDAPGSPKSSVVAPLSNDEGLKMGVFTTSFNLSKSVTAFVRYGYMMSAEDNETTGSKKIGQEVDTGAVYQMNPSTSVQFDYGRFMPGSYYSNTPRNPQISHLQSSGLIFRPPKLLFRICRIAL